MKGQQKSCWSKAYLSCSLIGVFSVFQATWSNGRELGLENRHAATASSLKAYKITIFEERANDIHENEILQRKASCVPK